MIKVKVDRCGFAALVWAFVLWEPSSWRRRTCSSVMTVLTAAYAWLPARSERRGRKMARNYRLKERFGPAERTSPDFLRVFAVAVGGV